MATAKRFGSIPMKSWGFDQAHAYLDGQERYFSTHSRKSRKVPKEESEFTPAVYIGNITHII